MGAPSESGRKSISSVNTNTPERGAPGPSPSSSSPPSKPAHNEASGRKDSIGSFSEVVVVPSNGDPQTNAPRQPSNPSPPTPTNVTPSRSSAGDLEPSTEHSPRKSSNPNPPRPPTPTATEDPEPSVDSRTSTQTNTNEYRRDAVHEKPEPSIASVPDAAREVKQLPQRPPSPKQETNHPLSRGSDNEETSTSSASDTIKEHLWKPYA